ncbi:unnamed protein product [Rhizoctonia solani]|uniref:Uncharacterized protein n=1 Tax=Rhizoctonia solani TaxID=456999 RepID=A0A8H3EC36_9AGAM|nr:unnamed protein product [Rhizoctonia solani]
MSLTNGHTQPSNDVYWTTNDPRNTGVIGYEGAKPVFFRFVTTTTLNSTRTVVWKGTSNPNVEQEVAWLDWESMNHLGTATIGRFQTPMTNLLQRGTTPRCRIFAIPGDGRRFEWRRCETDPCRYDLYDGSGKLCASHTVYLQPQRSAVAELNAVMNYWFKEDEMVSESWNRTTNRGAYRIPPPFRSSSFQLLLTSIISLTINRWIDQNGA